VEASPDQIEVCHPAADDHLRVVNARPLADEKQRGRAGRVDAGRAIPAEQLGREITDPGVEELEASGGVFVGHKRGQVLRGQPAGEAVDRPLEIGNDGGVALAPPAAVARPADRLDRPHEFHRLAGVGHHRPRVHEREPPRLHVEADMRHERRHHHGERGQRAAGGRRLHAGVETPAEGVAAVRKADDRAVERDGGEIGFQPAGVAGESLAVEPAAGGGQGHRDLQLAAAGVGLVDVLLLDCRVEGEDADRPAGADILGEGGPGLGRRIGAVEGAGVFGRGAGAAKRGGRLADVFDEPLIEQGALHEDAPGEHGGGGAADGHRRLRLAAAEVGIAQDRGVGGAGGGREEPGSVSDAARLGGRHAREEPAADTAELGRVAAADERGQVPAGQFLPDVAVGRDREEVEGGVEFRLQMGADAHVGDARTVGRIVLEGRAGVADQNRDLADARDVGQLREGNRQPGPPGLHRRHRGAGE